MAYYYSKNGEQFGPLPVEALLKVIDENTLVWNDDGSMQEWQTANKVSEINILLNKKSIPIEEPTQETFVSHRAIVAIDKKRIFEEYINKKLLAGFVISKKDEENFLVELELENGVIDNTNSFRTNKYLKRLLITAIIGLILTAFYWYRIYPSLIDDYAYEDYNNLGRKVPWYLDGHENWIFTVAIPLAINVYLWLKDYKAFSKLPKEYKTLKLRTVIDNSGKVLENTLNK